MVHTHEVIRHNLAELDLAKRECPEFALFCAGNLNHNNMIHAIGLRDLSRFHQWLVDSRSRGFEPVYEVLDFEYVREQVASHCVDPSVAKAVRGMTRRRFNNLIRDKKRMTVWGGKANTTRRHYGQNFAHTQSLIANWAIINGLDMPSLPEIATHYWSRANCFGRVKENYLNARKVVDAAMEAMESLDIPSHKVAHAYLMLSMGEMLAARAAEQIKSLTSIYDSSTGHVHRVKDRTARPVACTSCGLVYEISTWVVDTDEHLLYPAEKSLVDLGEHRRRRLSRMLEP